MEDWTPSNIAEPPDNGTEALKQGETRSSDLDDLVLGWKERQPEPGGATPWTTGASSRIQNRPMCHQDWPSSFALWWSLGGASLKVTSNRAYIWTVSVSIQMAIGVDGCRDCGQASICWKVICVATGFDYQLLMIDFNEYKMKKLIWTTSNLYS